jgi:hypothetical protein
MIAGLICFVATQAHAEKGERAAGTNFSCGDYVCTCDGSYKDCENMKKVCKTTLNCPPDTNKCFCDYKASPQPAPPTKVEPKAQPGGIEAPGRTPSGPILELEEAPQ